jgi:hypothetical protein
MPKRLGEDLPGRPWSEVADHVPDHLGEVLLPERRGEADHRDHRGEERECELEGERARVAEAVGRPGSGRPSRSLAAAARSA